MPRPIFLYKADPVRGAEWAAGFERKAPELEFRQWPLDGDPAQVRYLAAWDMVRLAEEAGISAGDQPGDRLARPDAGRGPGLAG